MRSSLGQRSLYRLNMLCVLTNMHTKSCCPPVDMCSVCPSELRIPENHRSAPRQKLQSFKRNDQIQIPSVSHMLVSQIKKKNTLLITVPTSQHTRHQSTVESTALTSWLTETWQEKNKNSNTSSCLNQTAMIHNHSHYRMCSYNTVWGPEAPPYPSSPLLTLSSGSLPSSSSSQAESERERARVCV